MILPSVSSFVEQHWTPIGALLATGCTALGGFWGFVFVRGGKPCLERWNIRVEKDSRDQALSRLVSGIRNVQKTGPVSKEHRDSVISGLDQLHKSQLRFDARHRKIQTAHQISIITVVLAASSWIAHKLEIDGHRFCSGCVILSFFCFALIIYLWSPLFIQAYKCGFMPDKEIQSSKPGRK